MNAVSFCIIATGKHEESLSAVIKSIQAQDVPRSEILVCGISAQRPGSQLFSKPEWIQQGELNKIRNFLCNKAKYKIIVFLSDEIVLAEDWYKNIREEDNFDIATCKIVDLNNKRCFDWAKYPRKCKNKKISLLHYEEWHPDAFIYIEHLIIMQRNAFKKIKFDEKTLYNKKFSSVDFCHKSADLGLKLRVFPKAVSVYQGYSDLQKFIKQKKNIESTAAYFYNLGLCSFRECEYYDAIFFLETAEKIMPSLLSKYNIGLSYLNINKFEEAKKWFNLIINTYKENSLVDEYQKNRYAQTFYNLGRIALFEGKKQNAVEFFRKTLQISEEHRKAKFFIEAISAVNKITEMK